jgi:hypothetical protein
VVVVVLVVLLKERLTAVGKLVERNLGGGLRQRLGPDEERVVGGTSGGRRNRRGEDGAVFFGSGLRLVPERSVVAVG